MNEKKEFLTEENYEKGKKKVIKLSLIVLFLGLIIGGSLIALGINNQTKAKNPERKKAVQTQIDSLNSELSTLKSKKNQEFFSNSFSEEYYKLDDQIDSKEKQVRDLQEQIESDYNSFKYIPLYVFGGFIIVFSCIIAGSIYLFAKRREITAFTAQQIMPVAQEGIEKMAPTVGNAAGSVAKGITKGIKDGLKDNEDSSN